jgi:hypothetical protein
MTFKPLPLALAFLLLVGSAHAAQTGPTGSTGTIQYNNNGQFGPYVIGPGLVVTTSGTTEVLSSTSTGGVSPAGPNGSIQYNASGAFGGYALGQNLGINTGAIDVVPAGNSGDIQTNASPFSLGSVGLSANSLLGASTSGVPISITLGTGLSLSTTGGVTYINSSGGGSTCGVTGIIAENGPCIVEENGPNIVEE